MDLPHVEVDLYFLIIYMCIKYESDILTFSKNNERKPFTGRTGRTYVRTVVKLYAPHFQIAGHKKLLGAEGMDGVSSEG